MTELPLKQRELAFVRAFPGSVGRFSDGRRAPWRSFVVAEQK